MSTRFANPDAPLRIDESLSPAAVNEWPQVRRDVALAIWAALVHGARPEHAPLVPPPPPEPFAPRSYSEGATIARSYVAGYAPEQAIVVAESFTRPLVTLFLCDVAPHVREDTSGEAGAWEVIQGLVNPSPLGDLAHWPIQDRIYARRALRADVEKPEAIEYARALAMEIPETVPRAFDVAAGTQWITTWHRERLPSEDAATAWLDALRVSLEHRAPVLSVALLRRFDAWRALAIRTALDVAREKIADDDPGKLTGDKRAMGELEAALSAVLASLAAHVQEDPEAALRSALRRTGAYGKADAEHVATRDAWSDPRRVAARLALALWCDRVAPRLRPSIATLDRRPYLALAILSSNVRREVEPSGQLTFDLRRPDDLDLRVRAIPAEIPEALVDRGIKLFSSLPGQRLLRWEIYQGDANKAADKRGDAAATIHVPGGIRALAFERLGLRSKEDEQKLRAVIEAQHVTEVRAPCGAWGPIATRYITPSAPGRSALLSLVLGPALVPFNRGTLTDEQARMVRLVPVPLELPPFAGDNSTKGAQAALQVWVLLHLRDHASVLARDGVVPFDESTRDRLADLAGVPRHARAAVWDRWQNDGQSSTGDGGGAAFLRFEGPDRVTLAPAYLPILEWLTRTGREMARRDAQHRASASGAKRPPKRRR